MGSSVSTATIEACATKYGPRNLAIVPTTTRETTTHRTNTVYLPLWNTKYVEPPPFTITITEPVYIVSTETGAQPTSTTTSTRTNLVESIVFQTIDSTSYETVLAAETFTTQTPAATVSAPAGFTPIASNAKNAGANTFTSSSSSTMLPPKRMARQDVQENISEDTALIGSEDRVLLDRLPLRAAEKSYTNANRVICDVTTSIRTETLKFFNVRHSTITETLLPGMQTDTLTTELTSTSTELPEPALVTVFEDTTETLEVTEIETATIQATTILTPTLELSRATAFAACSPDNMIGGIGGRAIVNAAIDKDEYQNVVEGLGAGYSFQSCCEACWLRANEFCYGSVVWNGACYVLLADQCDVSREWAYFATYLVDQNIAPFSASGMVVSNGACGQQVWDENYW